MNFKRHGYEKFVKQLTKELESAGYVVSTHEHNGIVTELMVQHDAPERLTPEITPAEITGVIGDLIGPEYLEPHWYSENGEVYVRTLVCYLGM